MGSDTLTIVIAIVIVVILIAVAVYVTPAKYRPWVKLLSLLGVLGAVAMAIWRVFARESPRQDESTPVEVDLPSPPQEVDVPTPVQTQKADRALLEIEREDEVQQHEMENLPEHGNEPDPSVVDFLRRRQDANTGEDSGDA